LFLTDAIRRFVRRATSVSGNRPSIRNSFSEKRRGVLMNRTFVFSFRRDRTHTRVIYV